MNIIIDFDVDKWYWLREGTKFSLWIFLVVIQMHKHNKIFFKDYKTNVNMWISNFQRVGIWNPVRMRDL